MKPKCFHPRINYYRDLRRVECLWLPGDVFYETIKNGIEQVVLVRRSKDKSIAGIIVSGVNLPLEEACSSL